MTRQEWLDIGYDKGIINQDDYEEITFSDAYKEWFVMKIQTTKQPTVDRIEVTYNRHYRDMPIIEKCISKITDTDIIVFLTEKRLSENISDRELGRIKQIIKGTLTYMRDVNKGGCPLHDWDKIVRNVPAEKLNSETRKEYAINTKDVEYIFRQVICNKIYYRKQSACLCICMNFYLGLRIGELSALQFSDFDLENKVVHIRKIESKYYARNEEGEKIGCMQYNIVNHTKTKTSMREVPLVPESIYIFNLIKAHHKECGYDSPFIAYDGNQTILSRSLDRTIRKLVSLCETMYFSSHGIRKTFATTLHFNNVPTRVISDILGHSEMSTTEKCYILSYEDNKEMYAKYMQDSIKYSL